MKNLGRECINFLYVEFESILKFWQVLSWIMLLAGYSLLILGHTLFTEPPIWMDVAGLIGIGVTLVNFFIALFIMFIYIIVSYQSRDYETARERLPFIGLYVVVSSILYMVVTL